MSNYVAIDIKLLLEGGSAFVNPRELLEDLSAEQATYKLDRTHTIAEIIAHLTYWQSWFYAGAAGEPRAYPESGDDSWFAVEPEAWDSLRVDFLAGLETIKSICDDAELLNRPFAKSSIVAGGHDKRTVGTTLLYTVALHNAHHYGQIITLRQHLGAWPPRAGGKRW